MPHRWPGPLAGGERGGMWRGPSTIHLKPGWCAKNLPLGFPLPLPQRAGISCEFYMCTCMHTRSTLIFVQPHTFDIHTIDTWIHTNIQTHNQTLKHTHTHTRTHAHTHTHTHTHTHVSAINWGLSFFTIWRRTFVFDIFRANRGHIYVFDFDFSHATVDISSAYYLSTNFQHTVPLKKSPLYMQEYITYNHMHIFPKRGPSTFWNMSSLNVVCRKTSTFGGGYRPPPPTHTHTLHLQVNCIWLQSCR